MILFYFNKGKKNHVSIYYNFKNRIKSIGS